MTTELTEYNCDKRKEKYIKNYAETQSSVNRQQAYRISQKPIYSFLFQLPAATVKPHITRQWYFSFNINFNFSYSSFSCSFSVIVLVWNNTYS